MNADHPRPTVLPLMAVSLMVIVLTGLYLANSEYFSLAFLSNNISTVQQWYLDHPVALHLLIFTLFLAAGFSPVPVTSLLTVACGAIFGFWHALLFVSFAASIAATCSFIVCRYVLAQAISAKYQVKLVWFYSKLHPEDFLHACLARLVPLLPFFLVNCALALSRIRIWRFYLSTQLGMLTYTVLFVNAGSQLQQLQSINQVFTLPVILSVVALIVVPLLLRRQFAHLLSEN